MPTVTATAPPVWSYREASAVLKKDQRTVARYARRLGLEREQGRRLDAEGMMRLAAEFGLSLDFKIPA